MENGASGNGHVAMAYEEQGLLIGEGRHSIDVAVQELKCSIKSNEELPHTGDSLELSMSFGETSGAQLNGNKKMINESVSDSITYDGLSYGASVLNGSSMVADVDLDSSNPADAGYRVEERKETENITHVNEVRELADRTEFHTRDVKEIKMEEVSTKELTRLATEDEIRALVNAAFDGNDEIAIGREVSVEEFSRVEVVKEEGGEGDVSKMTSSIAEEHKCEVTVEKSLQSHEETAPDANIALEVNNDENFSEAMHERSEIAEARETKETTPSDKKDVSVRENGTEEGQKGQGLLDLIKAKTRSLSRDRKLNKKEHDAEDESKTKNKSKDKSKRWSFFGKSGYKKESEKSSSSETSEEEHSTEKKIEGETGEDTRGEGKKEETAAPVNEEEAVISDNKKKSGHKKLGLSFFGKQSDKMHSESQAEASGELIKDDEKEKGETNGKHELEGESPDAHLAENNQSNLKSSTKEDAHMKPKEHKWFHFGRKTDKEGHDTEKEKKWNPFGKKTHKGEQVSAPVDQEDAGEIVSDEVKKDADIEDTAIRLNAETELINTDVNGAEMTAVSEEKVVGGYLNHPQNDSSVAEEDNTMKTDAAQNSAELNENPEQTAVPSETYEVSESGPTDSINWSVAVNFSEQTTDLTEDLISTEESSQITSDRPEVVEGNVNEGECRVEPLCDESLAAVVENQSIEPVTEESNIASETCSHPEETNQNENFTSEEATATTEKAEVEQKEAMMITKKFSFGTVFSRKDKKHDKQQASPTVETKEITDVVETNGSPVHEGNEDGANKVNDKKSPTWGSEKKKKFNFGLKFPHQKKQQKCHFPEKEVEPSLDKEVGVDEQNFGTEVLKIDKPEEGKDEVLTEAVEKVREKEEMEKDGDASLVIKEDSKDDGKKARTTHKIFSFAKKSKSYNIQEHDSEAQGKAGVTESLKSIEDKPKDEEGKVENKVQHPAQKGFSFGFIGKKKCASMDKTVVVSKQLVNVEENQAVPGIDNDEINTDNVEAKSSLDDVDIIKIAEAVVNKAIGNAVDLFQEASEPKQECEDFDANELAEVHEIKADSTCPLVLVEQSTEVANNAALDANNSSDENIVILPTDAENLHVPAVEVTEECVLSTIDVSIEGTGQEQETINSADVSTLVSAQHSSEVQAQQTAAEDTVPTTLKPETTADDGQVKDQKPSKKFSFSKLKFGKKHEKASIPEPCDSSGTKEQSVNKGDVTTNNVNEVDKIEVVQTTNDIAADDIQQLSSNVALTEEQVENQPSENVASQQKWQLFGKKYDKKRDKDTEADKEATLMKTTTIEIVPAEGENESHSKENKEDKPKKLAKKSHSVGKGLFGKLFSPKHKSEKIETFASDLSAEEEAVVSYAIQDEGQIVAETRWVRKSKQDETDGGAKKKTKSNDFEEMVQHTVSVLESSDQEPGSSSSEFFVVVAIDFGTAFSGYAFSFARDPDSIHMMRKWEGGDPGVINQKTPTIILLRPDGEFHSFGFTARDFYHDLDSADAANWMYFEKFKMALHSNAEDLNRDTCIVASNGRGYPALTVFTHALRFFKDHALKELSSRSSLTIVNDDIRWVITVPAIWKESAKLFMREAAYQAGIAGPDHRDRLLIALEPEAASIYIRRLRRSQLVPDRPAVRPLSPQKDSDHVNESVANLDYVADDIRPGTRYMVVDCGGGTVDITVHEMESEKGRLKELYKATGGPYGSMEVDREFERLMCDIFGTDFIESFKLKRPAGWIDLMIAFESRKRAANPFRNNALNVSLPFSFIDYHKKIFGTQVESSLKKYSNKDVRWSLQGMLRLMPDAMLALFQPTIDNIKNSIKKVVNNPDIGGIEYLFLVGGFSESPIVQSALRNEFKDQLKIVIPQDVGLTILKGAVCFGLDPTVMAARKSRQTYGVGIVNRFDPSVHSNDRLITRDGSDWCTGVFDSFVTADCTVSLGDTVTRRYTPAKQDQGVSIIHIYSSDSPAVRYVSDDGVKLCGTLRLDLTNIPPLIEDATVKRREIQTKMTFGGTEISVTALDVTTGHTVKSSIDFLSK